jgi:hypothetical protein
MDQVKELLEEAAANYSLFLATPWSNILITNSGTKTSGIQLPIQKCRLKDNKQKDLNRSLQNL